MSSSLIKHDSSGNNKIWWMALCSKCVRQKMIENIEIQKSYQSDGHMTPFMCPPDWLSHERQILYLFVITDVSNISRCKHCFNNQWPTYFNCVLSNKGARDILYIMHFFVRCYFSYLRAAMYFLYKSANTHFPCLIHLQLLYNSIIF